MSDDGMIYIVGTHSCELMREYGSVGFGGVLYSISRQYSRRLRLESRHRWSEWWVEVGIVSLQVRSGN